MGLKEPVRVERKVPGTQHQENLWKRIEVLE